MNLLQLTPGAGAMYCGNCLRDNTLVAELRRLGHQVTMVPLYLPLTLDETDQSAQVPIFFSGISVYLEQKVPVFARAPAWVRRPLTSRRLLRWAAGRAASTRPAEVGELTLSMLRGEEGRQAREADELLSWLRSQPKPDVVILSNALLLGMARRLRQELQRPVVCCLQGEDWFLDNLPEPHRTECWRELAVRASELEQFIAPSQYYAGVMQKRLGLRPDQTDVVYNGISLEGYDDAGANRPVAGTTPTIGFFARMCREKGLDLLVEAYIRLRQRGRAPAARLSIGGSCGPGDSAFVEQLQTRLAAVGLGHDVEFCPNLDRTAKVAFLRSLQVFSVPASYGEAFGLYLLEALAAGVPVVQPATAAFPEIVEATGGGVLCTPGDPEALATCLEDLLLQPNTAKALGQKGKAVVSQRFSAESMAKGLIGVLDRTCKLLDSRI